MSAFAWTLIVIGLVLTWTLLSEVRKPRIAYGEDQLFFYLKAGAPIAVPVKVVEAFFLGQGPAHVPGLDEDRTESVNLVARLSQRHPEWAQRDVKRALGHWCDGYITIRGTWCEPLTVEVIRRLNRRLHEINEGDTA